MQMFAYSLENILKEFSTKELENIVFNDTIGFESYLNLAEIETTYSTTKDSRNDTFLISNSNL